MTIRCVALDDTHAWTFPPDLAPYVARVLTVYVYDDEARTYLCEATASRYLVPVRTDVVHVEGTPDDVIEAIDTCVIENDSLEPTYMHAWRIDAEPCLRYDGVHADDEDPDARLEAAREYWQGNHETVPEKKASAA